MITSVIKYAVCTQDNSSLEADNPAPITEIELDTICISNIAINIPTTIAKKAMV
jgi:hypothetical protein